MIIEPFWDISKIIGKVIWNDLNNPHLIVEEIRPRNFVYPSNWGKHYRRFITARIRNKGNKRAENCLAHLMTDSIPEREFKLHWVDTPYEPRRDSAIKIDLEPQEPIDLDVVFSVCGDEQPKIQEPDLYSGTVYFSKPEPIPNVTYDPNIARGTYDASLYRPTPSDGGKIIDAKLPENRKFSGTWIANPYALYAPDNYREAYLPPGKHNITVDILLSEGTGCGFSCIIISNKDPYKLSFDPDSVKIPGI